MKFLISLSLSDKITRVGVWTLPAVVTLNPPCLELNAVKALVPLRPTSQSLSDRHRAASASGIISWSSLSESKALRIALFVIDCIHMRLMTLSAPATCITYLKISSPSLPASQALMIVSTSFFLIKRFSRFNLLSLFAMGCSSNFSGITGRCLIPHGSFLPFGPDGIFNSTRCPTAEEIKALSLSKYVFLSLPLFSNLPNSLDNTRARSVATLGFSAIMRVFDILRRRT